MLDLLSLERATLTGRPTRSRLSGRKSDTGNSLQRERLYTRLSEHPLPGLTQNEVNAHFDGMPNRYWERVNKAELMWGLETIHSFSNKAADSQTPATTVIADSRDCPERGFAKMMICSWDRPGLLAKIAAAFTALRINILRADAYTRADHLALDLFEVSDLSQCTLAPSERLKYLVFILEGALSDPPRFVSLWASQFHGVFARRGRCPIRVEFDNDHSSEYTVVRVETIDRLGLLHNLLSGLTDCGLNITQALVETNGDTVSDAFYVTDLAGRQVYDAGRLDRIRKALLRAVDSGTEPE